MPKKKNRKTAPKEAVKPPEVDKTPSTTPEDVNVASGVAGPVGKAVPEKPAEKPIKKHELELLSQELIEGEILETIYVKDIPAVGCLVRFIHVKANEGDKIISSGVFFIPTVAPIKGELRRSLV